MKKVSKVLLTIFSVGVIFALFAGGLSVIGYVAALIIGGETATNLCLTIFNDYFPIVIKVCSVAVAFGLVGMYLEKKKALTVSNDSDK